MTNDGSCDFLDLVMTIFHLSESHIIELWVMICWSLRNARNKMGFRECSGSSNSDPSLSKNSAARFSKPTPVI